MISLVSKTPVKFRWEDDLSETVVVIQPDDSSETVQAKLQRVLELETGRSLPVRPLGAAPGPPQRPQFTPADRAAEEARLAGVQAMGWNEDLSESDIENLPEW
jgi:hypothetical protein